MGFTDSFDETCVLLFCLDVEPNVCAASYHRQPACLPACMQACGNCSKQYPLQEDPGVAKCLLCKLIFPSFSSSLKNCKGQLRIPPKGGRGCLMSSPLSGISGLSFDSTLLSPLLFFCLVLLPFLSDRFLPAGPFF